MPEHTPDPDTVENFLSNAMLKLSVKDRNETTEEIHGVRCLAPNETPELLEKSLSEMYVALECIPRSEKVAYCKSQELFPHTTFAMNRDFRLRFLRCELFDAPKAAIRLVKYMDFILEIFGQDRIELLERPIYLKDLEREEETNNFLKSGHFQLLDYRDRSGRRVGVVFLTNEMMSYNVYARVSFCVFYVQRGIKNVILVSLQYSIESSRFYFILFLMCRACFLMFSLLLLFVNYFPQL